MTSAMPAGEGTEPDTALDGDAAPGTGLEPDTAADPAGAADIAGSVDIAGAADDNSPDSGSSITESRAEPPSAVTELDGPALENDEMRAGTIDLQSSEKKSAEAREIADELAAKTQPSAPETVMPG